MTDAALPTRADPTAKWWVQVRGKAFGPYALDRIARFMAEGRVRPTTLVADRPDGAWIQARRVLALR
ncbi:MAG TPA: GYF domain-containing protein, partial [Vitreimonas sp.]|nr:GYF domain-containing protein [Vitreimonas sp.]